jgi:1-acyl-sn-glycerol-3-phosphate acyltransferase
VLRRGLDRFIALFAAVVVLGYFRSVQVWGRSRIPQDRPVLLVVNHFNGFVDPVIVVKVLGACPACWARRRCGTSCPCGRCWPWPA